MSEIISISSNSLTASIDTMGAQLMSLRKGENTSGREIPTGGQDVLPSSSPLLAFSKTVKQNLQKVPSLLPVTDLLASTSLRLSSRVPLL